MKVAIEGPPNWREIIDRFPAALRNGVIYTYGDTIYNPSGGTLTSDLIAHETVHSRQQEATGGPAEWWARYLVDDQFRLAQELAAYRRQYQVYISQHLNRNARSRALRILAGDLSGALYGRLIGFDEAAAAIRG